MKWIVLPQGYESVLPEFEDYQWRLHLHENGQIALTPLRVFETPPEKWQPGIKATWNAAPRQVVFAVTYPKKPGPRDVALPDADAHHDIADPNGLIPRRDRAIAEHMLAILDAWDFPLDLRPLAVKPRVRAARLALRDRLFGSWGFSVGTCPEPAMLQAMLYEQAGRYSALGDLGGNAARDPAPRRGGEAALGPDVPSAARADRAAAAGRRHRRPPSSAGRVWARALRVHPRPGDGARPRVEARGVRFRQPMRSRASSSAALALTLLLFTCGRSAKPDVNEAMRRGRGAAVDADARGADVNHGKHGVPLLNAARGGDAELVALLLEHGATLDARDPDGANALTIATRGGHLGTIAVLAAAMQARGKSFDDKAGVRGRTALDDAVSIGSVEAVTLLLNAKANPNLADAFGETTLHLLAAVDPLRAAAIGAVLVTHGADFRVVDLRGFTPLHAAAMTDNIGVARALAPWPELPRAENAGRRDSARHRAPLSTRS